MAVQDEKEISVVKKTAGNKKPKAGKAFIALAVILLFAAVGYSHFSRAENVFTYYHITMDTAVELQFTAENSQAAAEIRDDIYDEIERLENLFSRSIQRSDVSAINRSPGGQPAIVSPEVFDVIDRALYYAEMSGGAFDPTIAPLTVLWGFWSQEHRVPSEQEIFETLELVDYKKVELDYVEGAVTLPSGEMALELGGIAKGYIVDRALEMFKAAGVESAFINAGGDIGLIGLKNDGSPWLIGVGHPRKDGKTIAVLPLTGGAVVTSGDYRRFFEQDGIKYHHILDPATGAPARELISVTIVAETVMEADVLSTAVFVLGPGNGFALIEKLPDVEGILVTPELDILVSSGLEGIVELSP